VTTFKQRKPRREPDVEANRAFIGELRVGDRVDVTIQTFSATNGYGQRRYKAAEVAMRAGVTYPTGWLVTGQSSNRSRIWLNPHTIINIKRTT